MKYSVEFTKLSKADLERFDNSVAKVIRKLINKVSENPLSKKEGGYGEPLGNKNNINLTGYYKIKLLKHGVRVVYKVVIEEKNMRIIVIAARTDDEVYKIAISRI